MVDEQFPEPCITLGAALAGMPLESPQRSAWPLLANRLPPAKHRPRWPIALAAGLLALALLPRGLPPSPQPTAGTSGVMVSQSIELAALMSESARLERLIADANENGASNATTAALSLDLEDSLHAVDGELEANREQGRQLALWQQRVQLLRNVAAMETSRHYLAADGRSLDVALVAAY
jgi:hypothetical protein